MEKVLRSFRATQKGCLLVAVRRHAKKPLAGTKQRRSLNAGLKVKERPAVSARAVIVSSLTDAVAAQLGTKPQRSMESSRPLELSRTMGATWPGAMA